MALDFRVASASFGPASGGEQDLNATVVFDRTVVRANAALNGFTIQFDDGDHHFFQETVDISAVFIQINVVTVTVRLALRDASGNFDDRFSGTAGVLVIADTA
jgi:hypothetical protein